MSAIGGFLRRNVPGLYFAATAAMNRGRRMFAPYSMFITDSLGGSFKTYIGQNDLEVLKEDLLRGSDAASGRVVEVICERFIGYPDERNRGTVDPRAPVIGGLLDVEHPESVAAISQAMKLASQNSGLDIKHVDASVFYFYHGLSLLPQRVIDYVKGGDFVDLGAFVGDSAIALNKYGYKKIYSVEMSKNSISAYKENLNKAGIATDRYEVINVAIGQRDDLPDIELPDTGSAGFSLMRKSGQYDVIKIQQKSFNSLVADYGMEPKFIKVDIEGYAMNFVRGALKALKDFRPVLSIAVYHNPVEFFEIKPLLERALPDYVFMLRKLTPGVKNNLCHSEVILLAYPAELQ